MKISVKSYEISSLKNPNLCLTLSLSNHSNIFSLEGMGCLWSIDASMFSVDHFSLYVGSSKKSRAPSIKSTVASELDL